MTANITPPAIRYHGAKYRLAPAIISRFPPHRVYVEPFGGSAGILLRKPRAHSEVYNDLDGRLVNLFRVLRDPNLAAQLAWSLRLTPFSRTEYDSADQRAGAPVEDARRTIIRAYQGHGAGGLQRSTSGFRASDRYAGTHPAQVWTSIPNRIEELCTRMRGVVIENRDAIEVIEQHDAPDALFYVDPPYLASTRGRDRYRHEMGSRRDHERLLEALVAARAMVMLSGYDSELYAERLVGWERVTFPALADGSRPRSEVLWSNPAAAAGTPRLFEALT